MKYKYRLSFMNLVSMKEEGSGGGGGGVGGGGGGGWGLNYFLLALGPVSRKPRLLFRPKNLFYACLVCIQNLSFNNIENNTMKLSLKEAKLAGL